jgi:hypothetical protein
MWRIASFVLLAWIISPELLSGSSVTIATSPVGLMVVVDGTAATAPQTFTWIAGSQHTLSVMSPQQGGVGTRYAFSAWSDGGGQTHTVSAPASDTTYSVTFKTQYLLTVTASPPGAGTFSFNPPSPDGYYDAQTQSPPSQLVAITPKGTGYIWHAWSGDVVGPFVFFVDPIISVPMDRPRNVVGVFDKSINVTFNRSSLNFGITADRSLVTSPQLVTAKFTATSPVNWTAEGDLPYFLASPYSGTGNVTLQVSVFGVPFCSIPFPCEITITSTSMTDLPNRAFVLINVATVTAGSSYGGFDTPRDGTVGLSGSIPVTGWALDSIEVTKVDIWREPIDGEAVQSNGLVSIGDAGFVSDARPDVAAVFPRAPLNYRAGWGYLLLTNLLPNGGNGTFRLHAIAHNKAGIATDLGVHTITVDNVHASKPFGTIDTPAPGETISGNTYVNFGWALTQNPYVIPIDGSTMMVYVDGVPLGHPAYGQFRSDIATMFPGLANTNGAVGFFFLDTTKLSNGVHTISWSVTDNANRRDGIGSRYFAVLNAGIGPVAAPEETVQAMPSGTVSLRRSFDEKRDAESLSPDDTGKYVIDLEELDRIQLQIGATNGHLLVNGELRSLPIGSTLSDGAFYWQAGLGFVGEYEFLFERRDVEPVHVRVVIHPKDSAAVERP